MLLGLFSLSQALRSELLFGKEMSLNVASRGARGFLPFEAQGENEWSPLEEMCLLCCHVHTISTVKHLFNVFQACTTGKSMEYSPLLCVSCVTCLT